MAAEIVAGAHHQRAHALPRGARQQRLHLDADPPLARHRMLRRALVDHLSRIGPEIVDRARQHQPRPLARAALTELSSIGITKPRQLR